MQFFPISVTGNIEKNTKPGRPEVKQEEVAAANVPGGCVIRSTVKTKNYIGDIETQTVISPLIPRVEVIQNEDGTYALSGEVINVTTELPDYEADPEPVPEDE